MPKNMTQIVGIVLVRNEDRFVEQAINNIINFCDEVLLVDHSSHDQTLSILQSLEKKYPQKISLHQVEDPSESQELLRSYIGTATWVFGVDGDEVYDPERLMVFRQRLMLGEFNDYWMVVGNVLHVDELDLNANKASGYMAPPSRSITKLYHFAAIEAWEGKTPERLHGGIPHFREGFDAQKKRSLQHETSWEEASFRCLHLCFIPRSSLMTSSMRLNIMETLAGGKLRRCWIVLRSFLRKIFHISECSTWKKDHYARGERQTVDVSSFFG